MRRPGGNFRALVFALLALACGHMLSTLLRTIPAISLDVMAGDPTLFMRRDAVDAAWSWVTPILETWAHGGKRWLPEYEAGTWGPLEADRRRMSPASPAARLRPDLRQRSQPCHRQR